ncbi:MAG TPA: hypothetical protein VHT95_07295 [Vicinamibacterales bacterium]|nr:hypothetical protein [Vicinamibacterales bacterium]
MSIGMRRPRAHAATGRGPESSRVVTGATTVKTPFFDPAPKTAPVA